MDSAQISIGSHVSKNNISTPYKIVHHLSKIKFDGESEISAIDHVYQFLQNCLTDHVIDEAIIGSIRGNLGSKMGLIRKHAKISFCELELKNQ